MAGFDDAAMALQKDFLDYHHLANPLPVDEWVNCLRAGLIPEERIPILPKHNSGIWLLMDCLWHVKCKNGGEMGDVIFPFLSANANFPARIPQGICGLAGNGNGLAKWQWCLMF